MTLYEVCSVCNINTGQLKKHLTKEHGWRYTEASPSMPVPLIPIPQPSIEPNTFTDDQGNIYKIIEYTLEVEQPDGYWAEEPQGVYVLVPIKREGQ
jgi:hypothetical protein